jgi:DNA-directed RNA polymerase specialized sigma24 family protein
METAIVDVNRVDDTVAQAASGDEVAFARLIAEHHEPMVRAAYVVVGDTELAREAAQNAWAIAWKRLGSLREHDRIRSWLVAICANESRQLIERSKRRQVIELSDAPPASSGGDPTDSIALVDFEHALARLKPDDRDTIGRWWIEGPVGVTGASISADPSEVTGVHMTGELANRLTVHFTAGDLPGRYAVVFDEVPLVIDVTE